MEQMTQSAQNIIAQVESLPELIRTEFETLDMRARRLLNHNECLSVKRIVITGCGDSHMAGLATELAFEQIAGIPTEPMTAMQAGRYGTPHFDKLFPRNPLTIGISVSGTVARTREAVALARKNGALTVALTANPDAPLAGAAEMMFDCTVPDFAPAPGIRSYRVSLLALYLLAIHLAEVNGRLTQDQANAMRQELKGTADAIEATIAATRERSHELANAVAEQTNYVFVGDGPNYATALFSAAKVIEAAGRHAMGQDTEEWAHLQYFVNTDPDTGLAARSLPSCPRAMRGSRANRPGSCRLPVRSRRYSARWSTPSPASSSPAISPRPSASHHSASSPASISRVARRSGIAR
jgi:glucosamine--fructose-6-phosphate aminotransferase (isomerizing)